MQLAFLSISNLTIKQPALIHAYVKELSMRMMKVIDAKLDVSVIIPLREKLRCAGKCLFPTSVLPRLMLKIVSTRYMLKNTVDAKLVAPRLS